MGTQGEQLCRTVYYETIAGFLRESTALSERMRGSGAARRVVKRDGADDEVASAFNAVVEASERRYLTAVDALDGEPVEEYRLRLRTAMKHEADAFVSSFSPAPPASPNWSSESSSFSSCPSPSLALADPLEEAIHEAHDKYRTTMLATVPEPVPQVRFLAAHNESATSALVFLRSFLEPLQCPQGSHDAAAKKLKQTIRRTFQELFSRNDVTTLEGVAFKQGDHAGAAWKMRYFTLNGGELQYFSATRREYKGSVATCEVLEAVPVSGSEAEGRALAKLAAAAGPALPCSLSSASLSDSHSSLGHLDSPSTAATSTPSAPWTYGLHVVTTKRTYKLLLESEAVCNRWQLALTNAARINGVVSLAKLL